MTKRTEQKELFLAALRGDVAAQRKCTSAGKPCGGRCIPKSWNCRIKGEGDTPPTRGNAVQLSNAQKEKLQKARNQRRIRAGLKAAGTVAGVVGVAAGAAALAKKNPQALRRTASKAGLGANFAGMASNIPGPIGGAAAVANLGLGAFQAGATAGASLGSNRRGVKRLAELKAAIAARDKVIFRTKTRVNDLKGTRNSFEVERTNLLSRMGDSGSKAQQRSLKSLSTAINKKNGEIATAESKLSALIRRNASLTKGSRKIEGLLGGNYNTAQKIYEGVEQTNKNYRAGRRQTSAMRQKGRPGAKKDKRSWQERFGLDEAEREDVIFTNKELHARVKAEAKRKFKVYPSAYANAWMVKEYKKRGGGFRNDDLKKWFNEKWVRMSAKGEILGPCGDRSKGEGKPRCLPEAKARALSKKERAKTVRAKRKADPKKNRSGKAKMVPNTFDEEGKKYSKTVTNPETGRKKTVKYGAKGYRIAPGTSKGDRYCARSFGDMKSHNKNCAGKDRNTPLCLSRTKWKCSGKRSRRDALTERQEAAMQRHAEHHTKKHMKEMRRLMEEGKSFSEAHKIAMKMVGK